MAPTPGPLARDHRWGTLAAVTLVPGTYVVVAALLGAVPDAVFWTGLLIVATVTAQGLYLLGRIRELTLARDLAEAASERRARVLIALSGMTGAEPDRVGEVLADALVALDPDAIVVFPVSDSTFRRTIERGRLASALTTHPSLLDEAVARVTSARRTVAFVHRGAWASPGGGWAESAAIVAAPIRTDDGLVAAAVTARIGKQAHDEDTIATIDELVVQAGRALTVAGELEGHRVARADLERRDEDRTARLEDVTREVAAPLSAIRALAQAAADPGVGEDERGRLLERISSRAGRAAVRLADLVDVDAARSRAVAIEPQALPLRPTVMAVLERLDPVMASRTRRVDVASGIAVHADPLLLPRLLEEIIVDVARRSGRRDLEVAATIEGESVTIAVTGHGDPIEDVLSAVGERVSDAGNRLARELVEAHGSVLQYQRSDTVLVAVFRLARALVADPDVETLIRLESPAPGDAVATDPPDPRHLEAELPGL